MNNILYSSLGAYRKGHGCSQVLIFAIDEWKRSLDQNNVVGMVLMDLSKAFDAIPHDLLIAKLFAYGFCQCTFSCAGQTREDDQFHYTYIWDDQYPIFTTGDSLYCILINFIEEKT